jgi:hypothetical protein
LSVYPCSQDRIRTCGHRSIGTKLPSSSVSGTTNYLPKFTGASTIGNSNLINDASGNLGLGVTPSAWSASWTAQQFGQAGSLFAFKSGSNYTVLSNNSYVIGGGYQSGDARYINDGLSTAYIQNNSGQHLWMTAPSGTAGNAISFTQAMTLNASGNLSIGNTNNTYKLDVNGTGNFSTARANYFDIPSGTGFNAFQMGADTFSGGWYVYNSTTGSYNFKIANSGAATFSSSVTATQFNVSTSGGTTQIYNTGSGHTVITNTTANKDINYQVSGTGGHYFTGAATFSSTGSFGNATLNGAYLVVKGANGVPAQSGTTTTAVFRVSSGTGLYNVLDFGTNESLDYSWIQSTRANSLGTYDKLLLQPNGGNLAIGTTTATWKLSVANEAVIGAQGGSDYTYISGGSGYGSLIRSYYATGAINNEIRGNGNNYFNVLLGSMGVGTNNPQYTLDVNGTGRFVGKLYANSALYTSRIIGGNLVAGNIASNMPSSPAYILLCDLNVAAGFSLSGKVNAASYTSWNVSDVYIRKDYSSLSGQAVITGVAKSGCDFSVVDITYNSGRYIALRFTSNPEIDVLWTGYRLTDQVSNGEFQVITSGVTVNSTYASY